ncbi:MAG TPA: 6-phosphogluconolactonase [Acidimicrobiales bacterium]|nr:6-phosphogluconolactonase [Acidimicrobiales bacterium]
MAHDLHVFEDTAALASAAAAYIADRARGVQARGVTFTMALSGGKTPWATFEKLAGESIYWGATLIYQVDERVVREDNDLRNLKSLRAALPDAPIVAMDVDSDDLEEACRQYAAELPPFFDLMQLGIGPDGHCASLIPGDPVLSVIDRLVALSGPYQDTLRMTLTYPAIERANQILWLVAGEDKREALAKLLANDPSIPAGRIGPVSSVVMADRAAVGS